MALSAPATLPSGLTVSQAYWAIETIEIVKKLHVVALLRAWPDASARHSGSSHIAQALIEFEQDIEQPVFTQAYVAAKTQGVLTDPIDC